MSFGINGPENTPAIQKAQNMMNNGGGGNLGYFQRGKKKKDKDDNILEKDEQDTFEFSNQLESDEYQEEKRDTDKNKEDNKNENTLDAIGVKIKNFWLQLHKVHSDEKTDD